jgi:hypothetical protein
VPKQAEDEAEQNATSKTIPSSNSSGFLSSKSFTKLNATNDGATAEADINYTTGSKWQIGLNISTPVTSKSQTVKPLTISGLSNNSSASLGVQKIFWGNGFNYDSKSYNEAIKALGKNKDDFKYDDLTDAEKRKFDRIAKVNWGTAFALTGKVGLEEQSFSYLSDSATSLAAQQSSNTAFNASVSLGMLNYKTGIFILTYSYKNVYQADDPSNYLIPLRTGGYVEQNLSPTPPTKLNSNAIRFEYLSNGQNSSIFRVNPNVNVEFSQKLFSFQLPVYFLKTDDKTPALNGGIYAGYITDKDFAFNFTRSNLGFGIFIGSSISNLFK